MEEHFDDAAAYDHAMQTALRLLAQREHGIFELRQKLIQRGFSPHLLTELLVALQEKDYVNDQRFAEALIRDRMQRGYGAQYIAQELKQKQVSAKFALAAIPEEQWQQAALDFARKKRLFDPQKLYITLYRHGFSRSEIEYAQQQLKREG